MSSTVTTTDSTGRARPVSIGVDVGGTSTRVGVVDAHGNCGSVSTTATPQGAGALTRHLIDEIGRVCGSADATVTAIGVGVPGRIVAESGSLSTAVNLGITEPTPLRNDLEAALRIPVTLGNDVDAAALGASRTLGLGHGGLALVSIGTGLAAGLVLDDVLHTGRVGAGEIGHVPVPGGREPCRCGQVGCAETVASGAAMLRAWGRPDADIEALWNAADEAEPTAVAVRKDCVGTLAWVVQNLVMLTDVAHLVLGGGVSRLGDRLLEPVRTELDGRASRSDLLASFTMSRRLLCAPRNIELGVVGAAAFTAEQTAS